MGTHHSTQIDARFPESDPWVATEDAAAVQDDLRWMERAAKLLRDKARIAGSAGLILIALLLAWDVIYGQNGLSAWSTKRAHDHQLTQEIQQLKQENDTLSRHIQRLQDDPATIEFQARQSLHYARPNEVIYALPASQTSSQAQDSSSAR